MVHPSDSQSSAAPASGPLHPSHQPQQLPPSSIPVHSSSYESTSTASSTTACPSSPSSSGSGSGGTAAGPTAEPSGDVVFSEQPPAKVFQNKEFSCTISVSNELLESLRNMEDERSRSGRLPAGGVSSTGDALKEPAGEGESELPVEVSVVEQNGIALSDRDYSLRKLLMDKRKGMIIFFVKIRKNSYYGRRPFVLMIRGRGQFAAMPAIYSEPIVVSAKKKKKRAKKSARHDPLAAPEANNRMPTFHRPNAELSQPFHEHQQQHTL
jgi:hypothetical protein